MDKRISSEYTFSIPNFSEKEICYSGISHKVISYLQMIKPLILQSESLDENLKLADLKHEGLDENLKLADLKHESLDENLKLADLKHESLDE
ncbi:MAG: hypothetical protein WCH34_14250, partial [Bacteroidota bacterium]